MASCCCRMCFLFHNTDLVWDNEQWLKVGDKFSLKISAAHIVDLYTTHDDKHSSISKKSCSCICQANRSKEKTFT